MVLLYAFIGKETTGYRRLCAKTRAEDAQCWSPATIGASRRKGCCKGRCNSCDVTLQWLCSGFEMRLKAWPCPGWFNAATPAINTARVLRSSTASSVQARARWECWEKCAIVCQADGKWRGWRGSNPRPLASEANTLSTELQPRDWRYCTVAQRAMTQLPLMGPRGALAAQPARATLYGHKGTFSTAACPCPMTAQTAWPRKACNGQMATQRRQKGDKKGGKRIDYACWQRRAD